MNKFLSIALLILLSGLVFGQTPRRPQTRPTSPAVKPFSKPKPAPSPTTVDPAAEKTRLDEVLALTSAAEKVAALTKFKADFPLSAQRGRAMESLVTARAILGDEKLQANENGEGIALFNLAVEEAPTPIPERLFNEIVSKFPANLFYREQRAAGLEIAAAIEKKSAGNAGQLLNLATFYLGIERGADARRLAESAIVIEPSSVTAYQTLGLAHRLNFDLEDSANAYSKALELDVASIAAKRSLAEMKRALGKPDEAAALYREIVAANENDASARTGLTLALFGSGKKSEAESELTKSLEQNPKNLSLLAGAAYWYAANGYGAKAVELAQKAVELEPRYIWGHIALARGLMGQNKPVDAERVLVMAKQYGNFPTLEYEIASARIMLGFYREAVEELQKSFALKDGSIQTRLGGRVVREEKNFTDLLAYERRASIFEPAAADDPETAAKLKSLFEITQKLNEPTPDEGELAALTDQFVKGDDKMKLHRQVYSATILLQKNLALSKALELVTAAVGNTDAGLDVSTPAAAVMASELYESRTVAFARNEIIVVPDVPRQTLSAILRGRIEELTGWTLYQQKSYPEAVVRLRRAISVLPDKSAWWRSSMWRLGNALEADGKDKEALASYVQSYKTDRPNALKYGVVEALYKKMNGSADGLEALIGPNPLAPVVAAEPTKPITRQPERVSPVTEARKRVEREVQTKAPFVGLPKKITENTAASDKEAEPATPIAESRTNNSEITESKTAVPTVKKDAATQVPLPEAKSDENAPASDTKTVEKLDAAENPSKAVETPKPKVEDSGDSKKPNETKPETAEPIIKPAEVSVTKAEDTEVKAKEIKTDARGGRKSEVVVELPPIIEPVKKTDAPLESTNPPAKSVEKAETPPQPGPELPAKTNASKDEPINLLRDPLADGEPEPKAEPSAEKPADSPRNTQPEKPFVKKPVVIVNDPLNDGKKSASTRSIFEPVIINVPGISAAKPPKKDPENSPEIAAETVKVSVDESVSSGASRVRVVDGKDVMSDVQCSFGFSPENISLINGGGSMGILVSITGEGDFKNVVAVSSSPKDVEVKAE
ncbi:MAG: tetratricopeptide repeat protein, partial [Pyrinomonadaceae bacterium]